MRRDPAASRRLLLDAARVEFAAAGIAGARIDRIAADAGVNKQRIYGLVGDKEALFEAVLIDVLEEHARALDGLPLTAAPGARLDLDAYVAQLEAYHRDHPELLRLMMWEALHYGPDTPVPGEQRRTAHYAEKTRALAAALGRPDDPEVARLLNTLIGLAAWPQALPQLNRFLQGPRDAPSGGSVQRLLRAHRSLPDEGSSPTEP